MEIFARIAEERIKEAMERGEFDDLPGKGRPLKLDDDAMVPEDMRMAFKICKNSGCLPPELQMRQEITGLRQLIETMDDGEERAAKVRELNLKLLRFNVAAKRPLNLDAAPGYGDRVEERLAGGG